MRRFLPWIILGGITLIAVVVVIEVVGAILYLRSPDRVVAGAFTRLLNAKSFTVALNATDDAPNGLSFNIDGAIDKQQLSKPVADINFSFQTASDDLSASGQAKAKDGELYLRFDRINGIANVLPAALQTIWADLNLNALLVVGQDQLFPQATGSLTEADLVAIKDMALKRIPFIPLGKGDSGWLGLTAVMHYRIGLDRDALAALVLDIKTAVKGALLSDTEKSEIAKAIAGSPLISGEVWIARNDGTLRAAVITAKGKDSTFHLNVRLSDYDKTVTVDAPETSQPLIELVRRLSGPTLGNAAVKLPFTIPVPIYDVDMKMPEVTGPTAGGQGKKPGPLPNLIRLFYGTDTPFAK